MAIEALEHGTTNEPSTLRSVRRSRGRTLRSRFWSAMQSTVAVRAIQLAIVVAIPVMWELGSGNPQTENVLVDEFYVGKPSLAWDALQMWWSDGTLWDATLATLHAALLGFVLGCVAGVAAGFAFGVSRFVNRVFNPFLLAVYSIPKLALAPLFLLWFGLGIESKIALVVTVVFFLVFFNTYSGVREVDRDLVNVLRVMGSSPWHIHRKVTLPSIATWVIAGLRVSVPYAFIAAVVAEMVSANVGLGVLIQRSSNAFNPSAMFAAIAVLVVLSLCLNGLVALLERRLLRWKPRVEDNVRAGI